MNHMKRISGIYMGHKWTPHLEANIQEEATRLGKQLARTATYADGHPALVNILEKLDVLKV